MTSERSAPASMITSVAEAGERLGRIDEAGEGEHDEHDQRDQISPHGFGDEERGGRQKDDKDERDLSCHRRGW
ncbi:MAG: hypothetical protein HY023_03980 [Chloroflexi bacterium]|nr:hypothetical protein [Chloroflexota bacterium]